MLDGQGHDVHGSGSDGREESGLPLVKLVLKRQEGWSDFRSRIDRGRLESQWWGPGEQWREGEKLTLRGQFRHFLE